TRPHTWPIPRASREITLTIRLAAVPSPNQQPCEETSVLIRRYDANSPSTRQATHLLLGSEELVNLEHVSKGPDSLKSITYRSAVGGGLFIDLDQGDHTTEGLPEPILTRKQKRNRRNNRQKTVKRQGQLADTIPTTEYSIHHIRAKPTPIRLVQSNEAILRKKKLGGVVRFTKFSDMDSRLQSQLERLSKHLISESEYLNENGNNHSSVGGTMYNSGWRKASTHNEII
ncbi:hypothetical protein PSTG_18158, partial [Puccinia striiformis f. sp. tritici PST-78]